MSRLASTALVFSAGFWLGAHSTRRWPDGRLEAGRLGAAVGEVAGAAPGALEAAAGALRSVLGGGGGGGGGAGDAGGVGGGGKGGLR